MSPAINPLAKFAFPTQPRHNGVGRTVMKSAIAATLVASLGLAACEYVPFTPQNRIEAAKAKIAIQTVNPMTVQWSDVKEHRGQVCGVFNAQEKGGSYGTETVWSGPLSFVTLDGEPTVVSNDSDCETAVRQWSQCHNAGDEAKVAQDVQACKAFQVEQKAMYDDQVADRMRSTGITATGDAERDQASWDAYYKAARIAASGGYDDPHSRFRWAAGDKWKAEYNRVMRLLPREATDAQKVAQAIQAERAATTLSEAYLRESDVP